MAGLVEATKDDFWDLVSDGTVLVDVWGPSCQRCIALMPFVEKLAEDKADRLKVVKLEAPKARRVCMDLRLMGLPAFLLFVGGEEVARLSRNDLSQEELAGWLDDHMTASERG